MRVSALIFLLFASLSFASDNEIISGAKASFSFVKEGDLDLWKRTRNEFHIRMFSIKLDDDKYWQKHLLILEEYEAKTHIGIPMLESKMKLTAWELTSTQLKEKLWEIEAEADSWEDKGPTIILTQYGCCDQPNKVYRYSTITGKLEE